ncbi:MAG: hypothetical protein WAR24_06560 [Candidatus Acidiferrales bacterium]
MREEKPRADEIELRLELALADVCQSKFDVADLLRRRFAPRQLDLGLVNVHPDDPAPGLDQAREIERNVAASTANVQTRHSRTDAHSLEQAERRWPHDSRQDPQPFPSFNAATDDVVRLFHALVPRSGSLYFRSWTHARTRSLRVGAPASRRLFSDLWSRPLGFSADAF